MTILAKVLVYFILIVSLVGLGVAVWIGVDVRDWEAERKALNGEIIDRREAQKREEDALRNLLVELNRGQRMMPWDVQGQLSDPPTPPSTTVAKAREENKSLDEENQDRANNASRLQVNHNTLLDEVEKARKATEAATAEQMRLREQIKPDPDKQPGQKALRDIIADHKNAKGRAEQETEQVRPDLVNDTERLRQVLTRNQELKKRLEELKAAGASANAK